MNGAFGDERYGFSSTERTVNGTSARPVGEPAGAGFVERDGLGRHDAEVVEVLAGGDLGAVDADELGREARRGRRHHVDVPVVGRPERDPLALTLDDEADRRALDAARRQAAVDAAPQHRRHLVAVEPVEDAAGLGGVDEAVVEAARVVDGVVDRRLGDLVEHHPLHRHLRLQILEEVPRDGLALAVFVGREVELRSVLQCGLAAP